MNAFHPLTNKNQGIRLHLHQGVLPGPGHKVRLLSALRRRDPIHQGATHPTVAGTAHVVADGVRRQPKGRLHVLVWRISGATCCRVLRGTGLNHEEEPEEPSTCNWTEAAKLCGGQDLFQRVSCIISCNYTDYTRNAFQSVCLPPAPGKCVPSDIVFGVKAP